MSKFVNTELDFESETELESDTELMAKSELKSDTEQLLRKTNGRFADFEQAEKSLLLFTLNK